jgi:predicted O-linked N-acetylglucosamine transferase (SPINDLY family)
LLAEREDFNAAVACYQSALAYDPGNLQVHNNLGAVCLQMDEVERAAACFEIAISKQPAPPEFHANMGSALLGLERQEEALVHFHRAVELAPKRADFQRSLGNTLLFLNRHQDAIECYRRSLELEPNAAETWGNLGSALTEVNQREEAVVSYRRALRISPDKHELGSVLAHHLQHLCEWEEWEALECRVLSEKSLASHEINPFTLLSLSSTARQQLIATRAGVDKSMRSGSKVYQSWPHKNALPRIGYLSADFRDHPVAHLLGEVFELHDRSRVEVFAYSSLGKDDRSAARQRIQTSAHHFVDVEPLSVKATAQRIHEDGIDVLIDLGGYTQNNRAGVFALRPAPVQVNYLGYPGTLGAAYIDYIITDRFVTPPEAQAHFSEKFVYMPHCFQPNDRRKAIAANTPGRKACGLPGQGFVFCSFNRSYKFTPQIFDVWMRLLKAVSGSVLWLSDGSQTMMDNLRREASRRGVEPQRVIFAPRVDVMAEHLARQRHADLFLDTLPYNAHTSASDALWAGLPVLTCAGETFASRVAGSLLHAVGLPELVTSSLTDYEALALKLAGDRALLASCRQRLLANRLTTPLFDSAGFVKDLERAYELMWQNYREGNPPRRLEV